MNKIRSSIHPIRSYVNFANAGGRRT